MNKKTIGYCKTPHVNDKKTPRREKIIKKMTKIVKKWFKKWSKMVEKNSYGFEKTSYGFYAPKKNPMVFYSYGFEIPNFTLLQTQTLSPGSG